MRQVSTTTTQSDSQVQLSDTNITGLTFAYASNSREVDNLVTREFHADPNLHKNNNVELVGDYSTSGSASVSFEWTWKWKPPKSIEDKGGGWRNSCSVWFSPHLLGYLGFTELLTDETSFSSTILGLTDCTAWLVSHISLQVS